MRVRAGDVEVTATTVGPAAAGPAAAAVPAAAGVAGMYTQYDGRDYIPFGVPVADGGPAAETLVTIMVRLPLASGAGAHLQSDIVFAGRIGCCWIRALTVPQRSLSVAVRL